MQLELGDIDDEEYLGAKRELMAAAARGARVARALRHVGSGGPVRVARGDTAEE